MKLNWAELPVVNNPLRAFEQRFEIGWVRASFEHKFAGILAVLEKAS